MPIVFNVYAFIEVLFILVPSIAAFLFFGVLGLPVPVVVWLIVGGLALLTAADLALRLLKTEERDTHFVADLLLPSRGGQVMFIPVWLTAAGLTLLTGASGLVMVKEALIG